MFKPDYEKENELLDKVENGEKLTPEEKEFLKDMHYYDEYKARLL